MIDDRFAANGKNEELLDALASGHVNINARDPDGLTLLHFAGMIGVAYGESAVDRGNATLAKQLLSLGAERNAQDNDGNTPLHYAYMCSHDELVELLVEAGVRTDLPNSDNQLPSQVQ